MPSAGMRKHFIGGRKRRRRLRYRGEYLSGQHPVPPHGPGRGRARADTWRHRSLEPIRPLHAIAARGAGALPAPAHAPGGRRRGAGPGAARALLVRLLGACRTLAGRSAHPPVRSLCPSLLGPWNHYGPAKRRTSVLAPPNVRLDRQSPTRPRSPAWRNHRDGARILPASGRDAHHPARMVAIAPVDRDATSPVTSAPCRSTTPLPASAPRASPA